MPAQAQLRTFSAGSSRLLTDYGISDGAAVVTLPRQRILCKVMTGSFGNPNGAELGQDQEVTHLPD